jgi:DNA-binding transcriptional ArsR family regulator
MRLNDDLNDRLSGGRLFDRSAEIAALLGALGNRKRFEIMCLLMHREMSVGAIAERVGLSQSALSQHLARLRSLNLVETRRERQTIYYSCNSHVVAELFTCLDALYAGKEPGHQSRA